MEEDWPGPLEPPCGPGLEEGVSSYGRKLSPPKLVEAVTGGPITPRPFLEYARAKFGEIYGF